MRNTTPSTHDMLELAAFDAMGLLDEQERRAFEEAFAVASPALRRRIRDEQRRVTGDDGLLPGVEPPAGLRSVVLTAVRDAAAAARSGETPREVLAKIAPVGAAMRRDVSPVWRAASIGLAAGMLVLLVAAGAVKAQWDDVMTHNEQIATTAALTQELSAAALASMIDPSDPKIAFTAQPGVNGELSALFDSEHGHIRLFYKSLPAAANGYTLVVVNDAGRVTETLGAFKPSPGPGMATIQASVPAGARLALVPFGGGTPLFITA